MCLLSRNASTWKVLATEIKVGGYALARTASSMIWIALSGTSISPSNFEAIFVSPSMGDEERLRRCRLFHVLLHGRISGCRSCVTASLDWHKVAMSIGSAYAAPLSDRAFTVAERVIVPTCCGLRPVAYRVSSAFPNTQDVADPLDTPLLFIVLIELSSLLHVLKSYFSC